MQQSNWLSEVFPWDIKSKNSNGRTPVVSWFWQGHCDYCSLPCGVVYEMFTVSFINQIPRARYILAWMDCCTIIVYNVYSKTPHSPLISAKLGCSCVSIITNMNRWNLSAAFNMNIRLWRYRNVNLMHVDTESWAAIWPSVIEIMRMLCMHLTGTCFSFAFLKVRLFFNVMLYFKLFGRVWVCVWEQIN